MCIVAKTTLFTEWENESIFSSKTHKMTCSLPAYVRVRCHEVEHEIKQQSHLFYWANV